MEGAACPEPNSMDDPEEKSPTSPSKGELGNPPNGAFRRDSLRHLWRTNKLGDASEQLNQEPTTKPPRRARKPGVLLKDQMVAGAKLARGETTSLTEGEYLPEKADGQKDPEGEESPAGELRRRTAKRKGQQPTNSDSAQSDASWGEIRSELPLERAPRPTRWGDRRVNKRDSSDSERSSRKRTSSYSIASSRYSGRSLSAAPRIYSTP